MNRVIRQVVVAPPDDVFRVTPEDHPPEHSEEQDTAAAALAEQKAELAHEVQKAQEAKEAAKQEAEELSKRILRTANTEAEKITRAAQEKAGAIRAAAQQEGYAEALKRREKEIHERLMRVDRILTEMTERQSRFFADYNKELESLALSVAEKIMAHRIEHDPKEMTDLVLQAVASVRTEDWVTVEVSDQLPELVRHLQDDYSEYLEKRQAEIAAQDMPKGSCVVQTSTGVTDASIATQLGNLRELMKMEELPE